MMPMIYLPVNFLFLKLKLALDIRYYMLKF